MKVAYYQDGELEVANIETDAGWYVCDVYRCSEESRARFERRIESLLAVLTMAGSSLITTEPKP